MIITLSEYNIIKEEVGNTVQSLSTRLIEAKKLGMEPKPLKDALIEVSGYKLAIDTWTQWDESYEGQTNYMSENQLRAIYSRTLILIMLVYP